MISSATQELSDSFHDSSFLQVTFKRSQLEQLVKMMRESNCHSFTLNVGADAETREVFTSMFVENERQSAFFTRAHEHIERIADGAHIEHTSTRARVSRI